MFAAPVGTRGEATILQAEGDGVADDLGAAWIAARDGDSDPVDRGDRWRPCVTGDVGAYRPDASPCCLLDDRRVDRTRVRGGVHEPGAQDIAEVEGPPPPGDHAGVRERPNVRRRFGRDDDHIGMRVDESADPALGDRARTDDEHALAAEFEVQGIRHWCSPHSFFGMPRQRPDRGSSPSPTGCVHGAQPIDG